MLATVPAAVGRPLTVYVVAPAAGVAVLDALAVRLPPLTVKPFGVVDVPPARMVDKFLN